MKINNFYSGSILPNQNIAGCINIFENVWPFDIDETIEGIEKECSDPESGAYWSKATVFNDGSDHRITNYRTNYVLHIDHAADNGNVFMQNIHNQMYMLLLSSTIPYSEKYEIPNLYHEPYQILKYNSGQEYKSHSDGGTASGRAVSAILYLNDNYEGGELEFVNFGIKIKPQAGMLILFPSNYAYSHIAHPVISGTKYAIVTWIHDRPL